MFISTAYAAAEGALAEAPSKWEAFGLNMMLVVILIMLFYVLLIMPQQKRFKKHKAMLDGLKKGDKVVTAGGLVGTIEKIVDDSDEAVVDLGDGVKVTALRSTIHNRKKA